MLELLVAIGLTAVAAAIVWQAGPLTARLRLHAAAAALVSEMRAAQARAIAERRPGRAHGLQFQIGSDRYLVVVRDGSTVSSRQEREMPGVTVTYARFGGSVPAEALFHGASLFGAPSGGGTVTLTSGRVHVCARLLPATGRIRVASTGCP